MNNMLKNIMFGAALATVGAAGVSAQDRIEIYSPNSDPSNPIRIAPRYDSRSALQGNIPVAAKLPESSLAGTRELSKEDAEMMLQLMKVVEETNTIDEINADDPLAGMSPDQRAFIEAMRGIMPMTPDQIRLFKKRYDESQGATRAPVRPDASRVTRSLDLTLRPGEETPVIRMQAGEVSTLTFSDRNGNAWPILSVTPGDAGAFNAQTAGPEGTSNILVVNTQEVYASSNMVVTLVDNPVPVILSLDARDQRVVDYRIDARIDGVGPNSNYAITDSDTLPATGDKTMIAFLDGIPPKGAEKRETSNSSVEAWMYNGELYVRTKSSLLSPAYVSKSSNVSGVSVYALSETPVVITQRNGRMDTVTIRSY
jgi:intracellular multiplication protein IcmK